MGLGGGGGGAFSAYACAFVTLIRARAAHFCWAFAPKEKCVNLYEMKGGVGMSLHEKGRNKKMPTPRHKVTHNPYIFVYPRPQHNIFRRQLDVKMLCCLLCLMHS